MSAPASRLARRSEDLAGELLAPAARGLAAKLIGESAHLPRRFLADLATNASQGTLAILSGHESSSLVLVVVLVGDRKSSKLAASDRTAKTPDSLVRQGEKLISLHLLGRH